jgi:beta-xylosidase
MFDEINIFVSHVVALNNVRVVATWDFLICYKMIV